MDSAFPWKTTVVAASNTYDLATVDQVKAAANISGATLDTWLKEQIENASRAIATHCERDFAKETLRDHFRLRRTHESLWLSRWPIVTIASITENGTALTSADYEADPDTGLVYRLSADTRISWPIGKIEVEFDGGYVLLTTLPHDVNDAAITLVKGAYFAKGKDALVKAEDIPGVARFEYWVGSVGEDGAFPPEVTSKLAPYRLVSI